MKSPGVPVKKGSFKLKLDLKKSFFAIGNGVYHAVTKQESSIAGDVSNFFESIGASFGPEHIAWKLITRAIQRTITDILFEYKDHLNKDIDEKSFFDVLSTMFNEEEEFELDSEFLANPAGFPFLKKITPHVRYFLTRYGLAEQTANSINIRRLTSYFIYALHEVWVEEPQTYEILLEKVDSPFSPHVKKEMAWNRYYAWLINQVDQRVFDENFGLSDIYIPLRCYYKEKVKQDEEHYYEREDYYSKKVVMAEEALIDWVERWDDGDYLHIVSGDPGSGKSSLSKMLAARLAKEGSKRTLFIPLHKYNLTNDLEEGIKRYIERSCFLAGEYLDFNDEQLELVIIFDGLDELAKSGKMSGELAKEFMSELERELNILNTQRTRVKVVVSGRIISVQSVMNENRRAGHEFHLLPFYINEDERENYVDENGMLDEDQRDIWWRKYGQLKGSDYAGMPEKLKRESLEDITAQPLLNFLVAYSGYSEREMSDETNLNKIYDSLISSVYKRVYENERCHTVLSERSIEERDFFRILEEIAIATWHGQGRTTTAKEIEEHCQSIKMKKLLKKFENDAKAGIINLLTAFYFRQQGVAQDGERAFEFTHKSFREFLTAKRIVKELGRIVKNLTKDDEEDDYGIDEKEALVRWARLFGPTAIDRYLYNFIETEVAREDKKVVKGWQEELIKLINYLLRQGMPMEKLELKSYKLATEQAANSEEGLLALLRCCSAHCEQRAELDFPDRFSFRRWLLRLDGSRKNRGIWPKVLSRLDLSAQFFYDKMSGETTPMVSWRKGVALARIGLSFGNLSWADLRGADFRGAVLYRTVLISADLFRANLRSADLRRADLNGANLCDANLCDANLRDANLRDADLRDADLRTSILRGTDLRNANLCGAYLYSADFRRAILCDADLRGSDFRGAYLSRADLRDAYLDGAGLREVTFSNTLIDYDNYIKLKERGVDVTGLIPFDEDGNQIEIHD